MKLKTILESVLSENSNVYTWDQSSKCLYDERGKPVYGKDEQNPLKFDTLFAVFVPNIIFSSPEPFWNAFSPIHISENAVA